MEETNTEMRDRQWRGLNPDESTQRLIDGLAELPPAELLRVLRLVVPQALESLPREERDQFLCELVEKP